ncbi:translation initiation factor IF-2-like [Dermochelys coriacea]|uniref:translation initiation factor IF-2-like n=1 Tax=Dermochelys coriacea TaxID=27794 RepID=UPI001CA936C4|nr:translation initiation factor IF-2-like [Dermochelys coriacea]
MALAPRTCPGPAANASPWHPARAHASDGRGRRSRSARARVALLLQTQAAEIRTGRASLLPHALVTWEFTPPSAPPSRAPNSASSGSPLSLVSRPHLAPAISRARSPPAEEPLPLLVLSVPRTRQRRGQRQWRLHTAPAPPLRAAAPSASFPSPRCSGDPLPAAPPAGSWGRRPAAAHARGVRLGAAPRSWTRRRATVLPEWREGDGLWLGASRPCPRGRDGRLARGRVLAIEGKILHQRLRLRGEPRQQ